MSLSDAPSNPKDEPARRVKSIIDEVIERRHSGEDVLDEVLITEHADLMPELAERLALLRQVELAAISADREGPPNADADEIAFLQPELPDFELLERIGIGGQGVVYKAFQRATKRYVAIKILFGYLATGKRRIRFEREVDVTSRLRHPNIVALHDAGVVRERPYYVMEFVQGLPLDNHVRVESLGVREIVALIVKIGCAVDYAHQRGVIHRDLKPTNVLVDLDGAPYILDFGLAVDHRILNEPGELVTEPGQCVGTLPYISPEQAKGDRSATVQTDVYSLGVTLFQLVSGTFPHPMEADTDSVRKAIIAQEPRNLRTAILLPESEARIDSEAVTDDLEAVVGRALAKDPRDRYRSMAEFVDDLQRFLNGEAVEAKADNRAYQAVKFLRRHRLPATIAAAFVLLLVGGMLALGSAWRRASDERDVARAVARSAHRMFQRVSGEIDNRIARLGGGLAIRDEMLNDLVDDLSQLAASVKADDSLTDLQAALEEKLGDVALALGQRDEANGHYQSFLRLSRGMTTNGPLYGLRLVRAHRKLGQIAEVYDSHFQRAIEIGESLRESHSTSQVEHELARARLDYGQRLFDSGRYLKARPLARAAREQLERLPGAEEFLVARAYSAEGNISALLGDRENAIESLETAYRLRSALCDRNPSDVTLRREMMVACQWLGDLNADTAEQAGYWFESAVKIGTYLTSVDPSNIRAWRESFAAHHRIARHFLRAGDLSSARSHADAAVAIAEKSPAQPDSSFWRRQLGFAEILRGRLDYKEQNWTQAKERFLVARQIRDDLVREQPDQLELKSELAHVHERIGSCERQLDNTEQAIANYTAACRLRDDLYERQPDVARHAYDLSLLQIKLSAAHIDMGNAQSRGAAFDLLNQAETRLIKLRDGGRIPVPKPEFESCMALLEHHRRRITDRN